MNATPEIALISPTWIALFAAAAGLLEIHSPRLFGSHILAASSRAEAIEKFSTAASNNRNTLNALCTSAILAKTVNSDATP
jgi:hypothetical protein